MAKNDEPKSMDIAKAGKSTPDETSRPVIVSNRKLVQDPMVKSDDTVDVPKTDDSKQSLASTGKKIEPTNNDIQPETVDEKPDISKPVEKTDSETKKDKTVKPDSDNADKDESKQESAIVDAVVDQAAANKKQENEEQRAAEDRTQKVKKLVASKQYFLPIGQITRRKQNRQASVVLVILLLFVAAYVAADMDLFKTPFSLPVEFFK